jgi:hypothetical protein
MIANPAGAGDVLIEGGLGTIFQPDSRNVPEKMSRGI